MMKLLVVVVMVLGMAGGAMAQAPGATGPLPPPAQGPSANGAPLPTAAPDTKADEVSPENALLLSIAGTAASYGAIAAARGNGTVIVIGALGTLVMPSIGRWYAGSATYSGLLIRSAAAVATIAGVVYAAGCEDCTTSTTNTGLALFLAGSAAYVSSTIYDIAMASHDAREHNARLHNVALVPVVPVASSRDHGGGYGLALAGRF